MSLVVRDAGLLSLLVDRGRTRTRHLGMPLGGAADRAALALGNALVGNPPDAVAVEITLSGPTLEATEPAACVVFGAPFQSAIDGRAIPGGTTFTLEPGDVLRVGGTLSGARGYFCVAGGFEVPEILGSRSALEPLRAGDELKCRAARIEARSLPFVSSIEPNPPAPFPKREGGAGRLRVLDGPQRDWFTDESFFEQDYEVSPRATAWACGSKALPCRAGLANSFRKRSRPARCK